MKINEKQLKNIIRKAILKEENLNGKVNIYTFYSKLYQAAENRQDYVDNNMIGRIAERLYDEYVYLANTISKNGGIKNIPEHAIYEYIDGVASSFGAYGKLYNLIPSIKNILCQALGIPERNEKPKLSDRWKTRKTRDEFYNSLNEEVADMDNDDEIRLIMPLIYQEYVELSNKINKLGGRENVPDNYIYTQIENFILKLGITNKRNEYRVGNALFRALNIDPIKAKKPFVPSNDIPKSIRKNMANSYPPVSNLHAKKSSPAKPATMPKALSYPGSKPPISNLPAKKSSPYGDNGSKWTSTASAPINEAKLKNIVRESIKKVLKEDD